MSCMTNQNYTLQCTMRSMFRLRTILLHKVANQFLSIYPCKQNLLHLFQSVLQLSKKKSHFERIEKEIYAGIFYILFFLCILIHITIYRLCIYIETHKIHYTYKCVQVFIYMYVCVCMHIHMSVSLCMYLYIYTERFFHLWNAEFISFSFNKERCLVK